MRTLHFNGQSYDLDALSDDARAQVSSLQFVDAEMTRLKAQLAVCQTARNAYIQALTPHLGALGVLAAAAAPQLTH